MLLQKRLRFTLLASWLFYTVVWGGYEGIRGCTGLGFKAYPPPNQHGNLKRRPHSLDSGSKIAQHGVHASLGEKSIEGLGILERVPMVCS